MSLQEQLIRLMAYLDAKRAVHDWHGVRDACVDIEILEAKIKEQQRR